VSGVRVSGGSPDKALEINVFQGLLFYPNEINGWMDPKLPKNYTIQKDVSQAGKSSGGLVTGL